MSQESLPTKPEEIHQELKQQLLTGNIDLEQFKDKLMELDQSTSDRLNAIKNFEILSDPEIVSFVEKQQEDIKKGYYQMLSFTELHMGQIKSFSEDKQEESLEYFKKSLEHEYQANAFSENIAYITATIAYLENDVQTLENLIDVDNRGNNNKILKNMLKGLKERGYPDYKHDYMTAFS